MTIKNKITSRALFLFYALIMLEGILMATPFGLFLYSFYLPFLEVARQSVLTAWVADKDILWIISPSGVAYYTDGDIEIIDDSQSLGNISRPFVYNEVPAVIEESPDGFSLMLFENNRWEEKHFFTIKQLEGDHRCINDIQVLVVDQKLHLFVKLGDTLFYRVGLPEGEGKNRSEWQPVVKSGCNWNTVLFDSRPVVFFNKTSQNYNEIAGVMFKDDQWEPFFSYDQAFPGDMGVFFVEPPNYFFMLLQGMPGSVKLLEFEGSELLGKFRYGSGFPFPKSMIAIMIIPQLGMMLLPLILAFILSGLMSKHRRTVHAAASLHMKYASLTRRAFAQLVDMVVVFGPSMILGLLFMSSFWDMEDFFVSGPAGMAGIFGMFAFSALWVLICFFCFQHSGGQARSHSRKVVDRHPGAGHEPSALRNRPWSVEESFKSCGWIFQLYGWYHGRRLE